MIDAIGNFIYGYNQGVLSGLLTMTSFEERMEAISLDSLAHPLADQRVDLDDWVSNSTRKAGSLPFLSWVPGWVVFSAVPGRDPFAQLRHSRQCCYLCGWHSHLEQRCSGWCILYDSWQVHYK